MNEFFVFRLDGSVLLADGVRAYPRVVTGSRDGVIYVPFEWRNEEVVILRKIKNKEDLKC